VSFKNFTAGFFQMMVFWVITVWRGVSLLWRFGGTATGNWFIYSKRENFWKILLFYRL